MLIIFPSLRVILSDSELTVLEAIPQYAGTNPQGRSVILDAKFVLSSGRKIDIEAQRANDDDHQQRVLYKETEEGQKDMCEIMERLASEAKEVGVARVNAPNSILINLNKLDNLNPMLST